MPVSIENSVRRSCLWSDRGAGGILNCVTEFFGAGGMFFNKPKAKYNFVNDLDSEVFNLFNVVKTQKEDLKTEFLSFIEDHTDLQKDIEIKRLAELIKYLNQAPLLKYVEKPYNTSRMEKFTEEVKNYVSLLNISLDTSLLPIPEIEEDTEEKEEQKVIN